MQSNQPSQPSYIYVKQQIPQPQIIQPVPRIVSQVPPSITYRPLLVNQSPKQMMEHVSPPRYSNPPSSSLPDFAQRGPLSNLPIQDNNMVNRVAQLEQQLDALKNLYVSLLSQQQEQNKSTDQFQNEIKRLKNQIELKEKVIQKLTDGEEDMNILQSIGDPNDYIRPQIFEDDPQRYQQPSKTSQVDSAKRNQLRQPQNNNDDNKQFQDGNYASIQNRQQYDGYSSQNGNSRNKLFQDKNQPYDENQRLKDAIEALKNEKLNQEQDKYDTKRLQDEIVQLKNQNDKLKKIVDQRNPQGEAQKYKENADQLNVYLQESLRQLDQFKDKYTEQADKINRIEKSNSILQLEADELRKQLQVQSDENDLLRGQMEQQMKQFSIKINEIEKLKIEAQQADKAKDLNSKLLDEISRLIKIDYRSSQFIPFIQSTINENNDLKKRLMDLEPYCQQLEQQIQGLQNDLAKMSEQLEAYEHEHFYYEDLKQKYAARNKIADENQSFLVLLTLCFAEIEQLRGRQEQSVILPKLPAESTRYSSYSIAENQQIRNQQIPDPQQYSKNQISYQQQFQELKN